MKRSQVKGSSVQEFKFPRGDEKVPPWHKVVNCSPGDHRVPGNTIKSDSILNLGSFKHKISFFHQNLNEIFRVW